MHLAAAICECCVTGAFPFLFLDVSVGVGGAAEVRQDMRLTARALFIGPFMPTPALTCRRCALTDCRDCSDTGSMGNVTLFLFLIAAIAMAAISFA